MRGKMEDVRMYPSKVPLNVNGLNRVIKRQGFSGWLSQLPPNATLACLEKLTGNRKRRLKERQRTRGRH